MKNVKFQIKTDGDIISAIDLENNTSVDLMSVFQVNGLPPVHFLNFYLTNDNILTVKISTNDLAIDPIAQVIFEQQFQLN